MNALNYSINFILLGALVTSFWLTGRFLTVLLAPGLRGAVAALSTAVTGIAAAVCAGELLGAIGLLSKPGLLIVAASSALVLNSQRRKRSHPPAASRSPTRLSVPDRLAIAAAILTAIHWAAPVLRSFEVGIYRQDSTWYHLPLAAWFAQTGSIADVLATDPMKLTVWFYPLNSELLHAIGMVLLGNDLASPLLNFGWMGLALLAAWCIGRPFGRAPVALLGAIVIVNSDMMLVQAGNAPSDIAALACLLAAVAILVNGSAPLVQPGPGSRAPLSIEPGSLAIASLAAGLAVGTKVTMLVPVAAITIGLLVASEKGARARRAAIWVGGLIATGGFWYLRNLIQAGNPLPWLQLGPLSGPSQESIYPRPAHSIAEYLADRHAWLDYFFPGLADTLGPAWPVVVFCALAGILLGLHRRHHPLVRVVALAAGLALISHAFNPISASGPDGGPSGFASNFRYAAPALALGLILLPICESRWTAQRVLLPTYVALVAIGTLASAEWPDARPWAAIVLGLAAVLVPLWLAKTGAPTIRRSAIVAAVTILAVAGYMQQDRYLDQRYRSDIAPPLDNPGFRSTDQWNLVQTWARAQRGMSIGIVGAPAAYGQYVFYGDDLSNRVRYIGEPGPHGALTPIRSCRRWRERVNAGNFDAVVITPEDPGSALLPPQLAWMGAGAAQPALRALPAGVFLVTGSLDPGSCKRAGQGFAPLANQPGLYLPPGLRR